MTKEIVIELKGSDHKFCFKIYVMTVGSTKEKVIFSRTTYTHALTEYIY